MKSTFEYSSPESVGVSSRAVEALLDELEQGDCEPHGLLMVRHGKVFAEGWWSPYGRDLFHGMQSLSKTYAGTAVGLAIYEGLVGLDEPLTDIFPEETEGVLSEYLHRLTVRHVLSMSIGMRELPVLDDRWIYNFFRVPIVDEPGTAFFYNSVGSTLLGEIVRRRTGCGLQEWLNKKLYSKLGMDAEKARWVCLQDGLEIGGSGLYTTIENNTRLGLLYLNGGIWDGERLLDEEFCRLASTKQIENALPDNVPKDGHMGYGFQMWMGKHPRTYCMCGAMGQYTVICPNEDIVISYTGTVNDANLAASDLVLNIFWKFLRTGLKTECRENAEGKPEDGCAGSTESERSALEARLKSLALPMEQSFLRDGQDQYIGCWRVTEGEWSLDMTTGGIMRSCFPTASIEEFCLEIEDKVLFLTAKTSDERTIQLQAGMDGRYRWNRLVTKPFPSEQVCACAALDDEKLVVSLRWVETCYLLRVTFWRDQTSLCISSLYDIVDPSGERRAHEAVAFPVSL